MKKENQKEGKEKKKEENVKRGFWEEKEDFSWFFTRERKTREREREREKRQGLFPSLYDLWRSSGRISSGQELKFIYLARATRGHQNQGVSTQFEISNFWEVESFGFRKCPRNFLELLLLLKR